MLATVPLLAAVLVPLLLLVEVLLLLCVRSKLHMREASQC